MKKIILLIVIGLIMTACGSGGGSSSDSDRGFTSRPPVPPANVPQYVGVGSTGTIVNSPDGNTWTEAVSSGVVRDFNSVAFDGIGRWVAVGTTGTIIHSPDGNIW